MTTFPTHIDANPGTQITREPLQIPASSPYIAYLNQRPDPKKTILIVDETGDERASVKYGKMITEGKYSINSADAALHAHSTDASATLYATYVGIGTPLRAKTINTIQTAINEAETDITELQTGSSESNTEIDTLKTRMTEAEGEIDDNQSDITDAQQDISALQDRATTAETDITALESSVSTAETDIGNLEIAMTTAQGNITTLQGQATTAEADIGNLEIAMTTAQGDITTLETSVGTAEGEIDALQAALAALQSAMTAAQNLINIINGSYVSGPASSGDNRIPLYDGTTGKTIKTSTLTATSASGTTTIVTSDPNILIRMDDYGYRFTETGFFVTDSTGNSYLLTVSGTDENITIEIGDTSSTNYIKIDTQAELTYIVGDTCINGTVQAPDSETSAGNQTPPSDLLLRAGNNTGDQMAIDGGSATLQAGTGYNNGAAQLKSGTTTLVVHQNPVNGTLTFANNGTTRFSVTTEGSVTAPNLPSTTADLPIIVIDASGNLKKATDGLTGTKSWDDPMSGQTHTVTLKNGRITAWATDS